MTRKITTIEGLAEMIQRTMASKEDLAAAVAPLATKEELYAVETRLDARMNKLDARMGGMDARMDNLDARMGLLQSDVHDIKEEMVYQHEFDDVRDRVKYIERKLAIESGV